ncbi:MAG: hypothetical protein JST39_07090 [Bacteroidetes bacterium]|nr:hypothetical protein [Bacteroidota bacterium]
MPTIIAVLVCFIASLVNYFIRNTPLYLKIFPVFLFCVLACEYFAYNLSRIPRNNLFLYNFNIVV